MTAGPGSPLRRIDPARAPGHHGGMTQSAVEDDSYEAWRDLQDVLEERDAEYWAGQDLDED